MKISEITLFLLPAATVGFSTPIFQEGKTQLAPSKHEGVEIELPDFDELFNRIQQASPLARVAINQEGGGFASVDDSKSSLQWNKLESNKNKLVHQIDKIDNFQDLGCPLLRFRASIEGPCIGEVFANFVMDTEERSKWDPSIKQVYEAYPIIDLDTANILMGYGRFGDCSRLGVGYCQTKKYLAVSGREQLTLCGIQDFADGSCVIWGTEMEEWHNHLLPDTEPRTTRSKSHLFSTTLVPTSDGSFDVEYILQIDVGGNLPGFITTPILCETIKTMFRHAKKTFARDDLLLPGIRKNHMKDLQSLLMTP